MSTKTLKKCIRCGTEVQNVTLCEDCQDHEDAQNHWHEEFMNDLLEEE